MENGFRRTWGGGGQWLISSKLLSSSVHLRGKPLNHFFPLFPPYLCIRGWQKAYALSIRSFSHLLSYTHQGSALGKYSLTWLGGESSQVKPLLSTIGHWSASVEQLEVARGHLTAATQEKLNVAGSLHLSCTTIKMWRCDISGYYSQQNLGCHY